MDKLKIIPLHDTVLFPKTNAKVVVSKDKSYEHHTFAADQEIIGLAVKANAKRDQLTSDSFYKIGTIIRVRSVVNNNNRTVLEGTTTHKVRILSIEETKTGFYADYDYLEEEVNLDSQGESEMTVFIKKIIHELGEKIPGGDSVLRPLEAMPHFMDIINYSMPYMNLSMAEKQYLLEINTTREKGLKFIEYLNKQRDFLELQFEMNEKFTKNTNKQYREAMLRQQLRAIQEELNETDGDKDELLKNIEASHMPAAVMKHALKEYRRLEAMQPNNSEANVIRTYLENMVALPWKSEPKAINLKDARKTLDDHHYGIDKVKERIMQHLAVMKMKEEKQGSIILLVGPPGTGKTSLGKSIAEALDRKYVRASLGGVRDEAEIRGHRRTYIGAMPGRIIQGMKKAGEANPVFVLDEIDKMTSSYQGDPASALLEVLDPEQNRNFSDHYLEVDYDLSDVLFIATANTLQTIPAPLLDRMEIIQISSYTNIEKRHIAKGHLVPEALDEVGLTDEQLSFSDEVIDKIIDEYTREAGVRGLKKQITKIARHMVEQLVREDDDIQTDVKVEQLIDILGVNRVRHEQVRDENRPGVVTGLAWTPVGGEILFIEGTFMPGHGKLTLTGQLGDVMKESANIAMSLVRSRLAHELTFFDFDKYDIHLHVPSGSTPKDGPSAGVALVTTIASLLTQRRVDSKTAMTGEVTLSGHVLPVGGIKEKVIGAHRSGITRVLLPKDNLDDLKDVPEEVKNSITFVGVETVEQVLQETLGVSLVDNQYFYEQMMSAKSE